MPKGAAHAATRDVKVERAMRAVNTLLPAGMTTQAALDQIIGTGEDTAVVRHETSVGLISQAELQAAIDNGKGDKPIASLLDTLGRSLKSSTNLAHVHSDQTLERGPATHGQIAMRRAAGGWPGGHPGCRRRDHAG